jgi:ectoine hydroxylase-related dioxygenase (phytanoyl-CoA dioxygenase family)
MRVRNGTLLIFPAYLQHSVDANASEEERISISFNIMFSDFTENISKPLWGNFTARRISRPKKVKARMVRKRQPARH